MENKSNSPYPTGTNHTAHICHQAPKSMFFHYVFNILLLITPITNIKPSIEARDTLQLEQEGRVGICRELPNKYISNKLTLYSINNICLVMKIIKGE